MDGHSSLLGFASPPHNVFGSTLFLSYIALALYASTSITRSLYRQYRFVSSSDFDRGKDDKQLKAVKDARKRHVKIYASLALLSFATLSYHMLWFLISSYLAWAKKSNIEVKDVPISSLKAWMWETSLFESFAKELVRDGPSATWTQVSILATYFWNIWMAQKAQKHGFTNRTLLPYIMLSQILPISFTTSLFIIQLHFSALGVSPGISTPGATADDVAQNVKAPKTPMKKTSLTLPTLLLNAPLLALPSLRNHASLIPLVLLTRLVLLLPHTGRVSLRDAHVVQSLAISAGFVAASLYKMRKVVDLKEVPWGCWSGGEAVKAVGWDAQIGVLVYVVLSWGGGV